MDRFVRGEPTTIPLADGETLTVRSRLTNGEQRAMFARMYRRGPPTPEAPAGVLEVNREQEGIAMVSAYLLDWSLREDGKPVPITDAVLDQMTPDSFHEIHVAIAKHDTAIREASEQEKKTLTGAAAS